MSILNDITNLVNSADAVIGYPATGQELPYVVARPLTAGTETESVNGKAIDWDFQFSLYCAAASVEASFNLAVMVMAELQGARVGNTTLSTSMGYSGAQVEGHYESQVTVQLNQGAL